MVRCRAKLGRRLRRACSARSRALAVELARLAGAEIVNSLGKLLAVRYKGAPEQEQRWRDPVSEVDGRVEQLIRARLAERFPGHDILGEESEERPGRGHDFIWAVDPIDGTTNFINGFPAFAASIGVLHKGQPIVGALWCASTHALRAGVYHAHRGGPLHFDDEPLKREHNPDIRRRLAGEPDLAQDRLHPFEVQEDRIGRDRDAPSLPPGSCASPASSARTSGTSPAASSSSNRPMGRSLRFAGTSGCRSRASSCPMPTGSRETFAIGAIPSSLARRTPWRS